MSPAVFFLFPSSRLFVTFTHGHRTILFAFYSLIVYRGTNKLLFFVSSPNVLIFRQFHCAYTCSPPFSPVTFILFGLMKSYWCFSHCFLGFHTILFLLQVLSVMLDKFSKPFRGSHVVLSPSSSFYVKPTCDNLLSRNPSTLRLSRDSYSSFCLFNMVKHPRSTRPLPLTCRIDSKHAIYTI